MPISEKTCPRVLASSDYAIVEEYHPNVAVLTVPQSVAQPLADRLIALGVKGFWNFTNVELSTQTKGVFFEDIHFVDTLLTLSYRISRPEELY